MCKNILPCYILNTMIKIYVLQDPRDGNKVYIGKTSQRLCQRFASHMSPKDHNKSHNANWIRKLKKLGLKPVMYLIEEVVGNCWEEREKHWIQYYKDMHYNLVNGTIGGDGGLEGFTHSDETKQKIKDKRYGWVPSAETREIWSKQRLGRPSWNKGKHVSNETKLKLSKSVSKTMNTQEMKKHISETAKGRIPWNKGIKMTTPSLKKGTHLSEEQKQKIRDSLKQTFSDPERRIKVGAPKGNIPWNKGMTFKNIPIVVP